MPTDFERREEVQNAFDALREDVVLLRLAVMGTQVQLDQTTLRCFIRLSQNLEEDVNAAARLCQGTE